MYYIIGIIVAVIGFSILGLFLNQIILFHERAPIRSTIGLVMLALWGIGSIVEQPARRWYRDYQRAQYAKNELIPFTASEKAMNGCIKAFNEEPFLATAWKRNLPKGAQDKTQVNVYQHQARDKYTRYIFVIPETLKQNWAFWVEADVPRYSFLKTDPRIEKAPRKLHFRKDDYPGYFMRYNAVSCAPTVAGVKLGVMDKYYVTIEGKFTRDSVIRYHQAMDENPGTADNIFHYQVENLGKGIPFHKEMLTPESDGMKQVYSMK